MKYSTNYSTSQLIGLVALRWAIGWHFLYEGITKLLNPSWSAYGYLIDSQGLLSDFFISMAKNPNLLEIINLLNVWGLILVGAGLILGCFAKIASYGGILLLLFYNLSHPSVFGSQYMAPSEGSYLWINKNWIELIAIFVLVVFPTSKIFGLDLYIFNIKEKKYSNEKFRSRKKRS